MANLIQALRPILIPVDAMLILILCGWCASDPVGFDAFIGWISVAIFLAYFALMIFSDNRIFPKLPIVLSAELSFSIFYFVIFYMPYVRDLLGIGHYWSSSMISKTFPWNGNKAILISTAAYVSFHLGILIAGRVPPLLRYSVQKREAVGAYNKFDWMVLFLLGSVILLIMGAGIKSADTDRYGLTHAQAVAASSSGGSAIADNIYVVTIILCIVAVSRIVTAIARRGSLSPALIGLLAVVLFWSMRSIASGDRNNFLLIALAAAGGCATFVKRIRWSAVIVGVIVLFVGYQVVEITRSFDASKGESEIEAIDKYITESNDVDDNGSFGNTTITLRAMFDIVPSKRPYGFGYYKMVGFSGIVPLVRGFVLNPKDKITTTADALTLYILGPNAVWNTGSNLISDIYMDFGLWGVPVLIAGIGFVLQSSRNSIVKNGLTSKRAFVYIVLLASISEIPRYSFDFPVRMFVWGWAMFAIYEGVFLRHKPEHNQIRPPHVDMG